MNEAHRVGGDRGAPAGQRQLARLRRQGGEEPVRHVSVSPGQFVEHRRFAGIRIAD